MEPTIYHARAIVLEVIRLRCLPRDSRRWKENNFMPICVGAPKRAASLCSQPSFNALKLSSG